MITTTTMTTPNILGIAPIETPTKIPPVTVRRMIGEGTTQAATAADGSLPSGKNKKRVSFAPFVHTNSRVQDPLALVDPRALWYNLNALRAELRAEMRLRLQKQRQSETNNCDDKSLSSSTSFSLRGLEAFLDQSVKERRQKTRAKAAATVLKEQARQRRIKSEDAARLAALYRQAAISSETEARGVGLSDAKEAAIAERS